MKMNYIFLNLFGLPSGSADLQEQIRKAVCELLGMDYEKQGQLIVVFFNAASIDNGWRRLEIHAHLGKKDLVGKVTGVATGVKEVVGGSNFVATYSDQDPIILD